MSQMKMKRTDAPCNCTTTPTGRYTHLGTYDGPPGHGLTWGVEYSLIYCNNSGDVTLRDDRGQWVYTKGSVFGSIKDLSMTGGAPIPMPDLDDWEDDEAFVPDPSDPNFGIEAIVRDVAPVPDGPKSTEDLRAHRYTPDLY